MRKEMAAAEVGDDVYGDDPTVRALEEETAGILGKHAAVYMPTGTMSNQVGIRAHTEPGDAVLLEEHAHVYALEGGAPSAIAGVVPHLISGRRGIFDSSDVARVLGEPHPFVPATIRAPAKLLCVENTHNLGGGSIWPLDALAEVTEFCRRNSLRLHLDGARLWHASAATGIEEREYAAPFDSVSVCFSKALGAPMGSCLAGSPEFIARARRFKQMFGGGVRQAGIMAAGALYGLRNHRQLLGDLHAMTRKFAEGLATIPGINLNPSMVETNIVRFGLVHCTAGEFVRVAHAQGLYMLPSGPAGVRAVFYLDISDADVQQALTIVESAVRQLGEGRIGGRGSNHSNRSAIQS